MSCTATLDIEKVNTALSSLEGTEKIIAGSDAHLDFILDIQAALAENTRLTRSLVDSIEENFNFYTPTRAQELIAKAFPLFDLVKNIKQSIQEVEMFDAVKEYWLNFEVEVDDLFEIINDLSRYKAVINDDPSAFF